MKQLRVGLVTMSAFFACSLGQAHAKVIISEFLAVNDKGLKDANGERSDWIEIHNAGDATVDLAGWTLTDDADDLSKRYETMCDPRLNGSQSIDIAFRIAELLHKN